MIQLTDKIIGYENEVFNSNTIKAGFQMTFDNGNTISVQFGCGNYCVNKHISRDNSTDAEIAIWNIEGVWYNFVGDNVAGYCNMDEVAKWIFFASTNTF